MKDFIYSKKFDDYLKGKLQKDEKLSFEEELRQDPLLRNEVKWQQEVYQSLGDARRVYLKNRLNQIPVNTAAWYNFTGLQWAAVVSSFLLLTGGSYYYFASSSIDSNSIEQEEIVVSSIDIKVPENNQQVLLEKVKPTLSLPSYKEEIPQDESLSASSEILLLNSTETRGTKERSYEKQESGNEVIPEIVRPDVLSSFHEESQKIDYSDFEVPDKTLLQKPESSVSEVEIETVVDSKYPFHYQWYNHKLYLHGDFQGIPYKIIALNQDEEKKLFLEFNGEFYRLKKEQKDIVPLEVIQDSTMINALIKLSH